MALSHNSSSVSQTGRGWCGASSGWAAAIIANASAIALVFRSRRDEWIIALPGRFNTVREILDLAFSSKLRRNPARHMMKSWCEAVQIARPAIEFITAVTKS
jgi:hypothetical protein